MIKVGEVVGDAMLYLLEPVYLGIREATAKGCAG